MRVLLIVNASASSVTARRRVLIQKIFAADHEVEVAETNRRGHATALALDAARSGVGAVVTLGGDGTLNEVANGLVGSATAMAALPGGSTNVFARAIGLPDEPTDAALVVADALAAGQIHPIGAGSVNGRVFLFHVGIGWDAAVVEIVERHSEMKRYAGHALFVAAGLRAFFQTYDRSRPHFRVVHADGRSIEDGSFAVVLNLSPYTFVGNRPFNIGSEVTLDRPLACVCIRSMKSMMFLRLMASALGSGRFLQRSAAADLRTDLDSLVIEGFGPVPYQVDGDHLGDTERLEFRHLPNALRLVVPPGLRFT